MMGWEGRRGRNVNNGARRERSGSRAVKVLTGKTWKQGNAKHAENNKHETTRKERENANKQSINIEPGMRNVEGMLALTANDQHTSKTKTCKQRGRTDAKRNRNAIIKCRGAETVSSKTDELENEQSCRNEVEAKRRGRLSK
ncbi:hypothetical protein R1flu_000520 [Riccia fluitans]|uniref:Uncharacterized protein n=1 Tax=Riccia fluitans TaxID=41844 RepID=A0ABD1Y149_9MARC